MNHNLNKKLLAFSIITIPILTFLFGTRKSPFQYTLSMIGNWFNYKTEFIIWGIITSFLLTIFIINIYKKTKFKNKKAYSLLYISSIFLILTVISPTISTEPIPIELRNPQINIHTILGISFAIFLIISLYLFTKYLSSINQKLSLNSIKLLMITVGGSILTLTIFGITGVFEIFFFISLSGFLIITNKKVNKILKKLSLMKK